MGHEVDIHESVYRIHDSMVEMTKISRLLMAVDAGQIAEFSGKTLKEVSIPGNIVLLCVNSCVHSFCTYFRNRCRNQRKGALRWSF